MNFMIIIVNLPVLLEMVVKLFNVAIDAIFKNWAALQLAVKHVSENKIQFILSSILFISIPTDHQNVFLFPRKPEVPRVKKRQTGWRVPQKIGSMKIKTYKTSR